MLTRLLGTTGALRRSCFSRRDTGVCLNNMETTGICVNVTYLNLLITNLNDSMIILSIPNKYPPRNICTVDTHSTRTMLRYLHTAVKHSNLSKNTGFCDHLEEDELVRSHDLHYRRFAAKYASRVRLCDQRTHSMETSLSIRILGSKAIYC